MRRIKDIIGETLGKTIAITLTAMFMAASGKCFAQAKLAIHSNHNSNTKNGIYFCPKDDAAEVYLTWMAGGEKWTKTKVSWHISEADANNGTNSIKTYTDTPFGECKAQFPREIVNPTGAKEPKSITAYARIENTETGEVEIVSEKVTDLYIQDVEVDLGEMCEGGSLNLLNFLQYAGSQYYWYDAETGTAVQLAEFLAASTLPAGEHKYLLKIKKDNCYSKGTINTLTIKSKGAPKSNGMVIYSPDDAKSGKFLNIQEQSQKTNGKNAVDTGTGDCELIWYDGDGNKAGGIDELTPEVPDEGCMKTFMVYAAQDCGCGITPKASVMVMVYVVPKPTATGTAVCIGDKSDTTVTIGTKINTLNATEAKTKYSIEISETEDFATTLFSGASGEDGNITITIPRTAQGKKTIYVRQKDENGYTGAPTEAEIEIIEAEEPTLAKAEHIFCLSEATEIDLTQFAIGGDIEWSGDDTKFTTAGTKEFQARGYKTLPASTKRCYSKAKTLRATAETLTAKIKGASEACPFVPITLTAEVNASETYTTKWTVGTIDITGTPNGDEIEATWAKSESGEGTITAEIKGRVCKKEISHTIKGGKGKIEGTIALTNSNGGKNTYTAGEEIEFETCDGKATLATNLTATEGAFTLKKQGGATSSGTMADGKANEDIAEEGKYTLTYTNKCETDFSLTVKKKTVEKATLDETSRKVCINGGAKEVNLTYFETSEQTVWSEGETEIDNGKASISTTDERKFTAKRYFDIRTDDGKTARCLSEGTDLKIKGETLTATISGDEETCTGKGAAEVEVTATEGTYTTTWESEPQNATKQGANKNEATITTNGGSTTATATIETGVCKVSLSHTLKQIKGIAEGKIYIANTDGGENTYDANDAINFMTCDGMATVRTMLTATEDGYTLWRGEAKVATGNFDNGEETLEIGKEGEYRIEYTNKCKTVVEFKVAKKEMWVPTMTKTREAVCINEWAKEIDLTAYTEESNVIWSEGGNTLSSTKITIDATGEREFEARLYYNIETENGRTSTCLSDAEGLTIKAETLTAAINAPNSVCPGESTTLSAKIESSTTYNIKWECEPSGAIESGQGTEALKVKINGYDAKAGLEVRTEACRATDTHIIYEGEGITKGTAVFTQEEGRRKTYKAEDAPVFVSCGTEFAATINLERTTADYTITTPSGKKESGSKGTSESIEIADKEEGKYTIEYTNKCPAKAVFTVEYMRPKPTLSTKGIFTCEGNSPSIEVSGIDEYEAEWMKDGALMGKKGMRLTLNEIGHEDEGRYSITMRRDGCTFETKEETNVRIYNQPEVYAEASRDTICTGSMTTLTLTHSPEFSGTKYEWEASEDMLTALSTDVMTVRPAKSGKHTYRATMTSGDCKKRTAEITIVCDPVIEGKLEADEALCSGVETMIDASPFGAEEYRWSSADTNADGKTEARITARPAAPKTEYEVWMRRGQCEKKVRHTLSVGKTPEIVAVDSISPGAIEIRTDRDGDGLTYIIDDKDGDGNNTKEGLSFGRHKVTVRDEAGCHSDTFIVVLEPITSVPKVFTPDGDGINDKIGIPKEYAQYPSTEMQIYDRTGKLLVTLNGEGETEWDGTYNGNKMPSTDYWYVIFVHELRKYYTGHFTLLRGGE